MDRFAAICEELAGHSSRLRKVAILGSYFQSLDDADLARAVRFFCGQPVGSAAATGVMFGREAAATLSVGYSLLRDAGLAVTGWDEETWRVCHREVGDTGEATSLLLAGHTRDEPLTLAAAEEIYLALYRMRKTADKSALLERTFAAHRPAALKYFVKVITGNLRIGLQEKTVEEGVAAACGCPADAVRAANNRLGDLSRVALAARHGELEAIEARLFHPMDFMLAKPLDALADLPEPENWLIEDKYDGIRAQVHVSDGQTRIYSRSMDEITKSYPDLTELLVRLPESAILDGEILAWREGRALAFAQLQQRLARKTVSAAMLADVPVVFMAYDLLYAGGKLFLDEPIERRRAELERMVTAAATDRLLISPQTSLATHEAIDQMFDSARERGNEGLVLKRRGSAYEPGRRGGAWTKLKKAYATLDVVITAAEQGHGKRATVFSDYTFAVREGERFLNVGKAYSGLTDAEIRELTRLLRAAALERFGRVMLVRPEIVLEVAFDGIQQSPRHKSGYALRFPRIVNWRRDKRPEDADTLQRVRELFESALNLTASRRSAD